LRMFYKLFTISIAAAIIALIISQLTLSSNVAASINYLKTADVSSAASVIVYSVILIIFVSMFFVSMILASKIKFEALSTVLILSFLLSILLTSLLSYTYLVQATDMLSQLTYIQKILKLFSYPVYFSIATLNIQVTWMIFIIIFIAVYNSATYYLLEV